MSARLPTQRDAIATLAIVGAVTTILVARPIARKLSAHPTKDACAEALDRHQEQLARAQERKPPPREEIQAAEDRGDAIARCTHDLTASEIECATKSNNADEFERCLP